MKKLHLVAIFLCLLWLSAGYSACWTHRPIDDDELHFATCRSAWDRGVHRVVLCILPVPLQLRFAARFAAARNFPTRAACPTWHHRARTDWPRISTILRRNRLAMEKENTARAVRCLRSTIYHHHRYKLRALYGMPNFDRRRGPLCIWCIRLGGTNSSACDRRLTDFVGLCHRTHTNSMPVTFFRRTCWRYLDFSDLYRSLARQPVCSGHACAFAPVWRGKSNPPAGLFALPMAQQICRCRATISR